jgi:hypothetical protein
LFSFLKSSLKAIGYFPQRLTHWVIPRVQKSAVPDVNRINSLDLEELIQCRIADYNNLGGTFPAIVIGAALGGAAAQISLAFGGPFLPQAFVLTQKGGSPSGDAQEYFQRSAEAAKRFAERYPGIITIQHYDPVHDGWLTKTTNHLRIKFINLPNTYQRFIRERLEPGGSVVYLDCGAEWLRYRVGERSVFQIGGWGEISAQEFLQGSDRLRAYCQQEGFQQGQWGLDGYPLETGAESEWGCEPGLAEMIASFCQDAGYRFVHVQFPHPQDFSRMAYWMANRRLEKLGLSPRGVMVEMFSQFDSTAVLRGGLLPLWLIFNTKDSVEFLEDMVPMFPSGVPVFFSPLATFSYTPDIAPWREWLRVLSGRNWINVGTRPSHYPADTWTLLSWNRALRRFSNDQDLGELPLISVEEMEIYLKCDRS